MYTNQYKFKYLEWHSPEEIHQTTLKWESELAFIRVEQSFLQELLTTYGIDILNQNKLKTVQSLATKLTKNEQAILKLDVLIEEHRNALEVLVDGIDELQKEKAFKDRHLLLELKLDDFLRAYRLLKKQIFDAIGEVMKQKKQKQLLK